MQGAVEISTKSDVVNFIIFKRKLRQQIRYFGLILAFVACAMSLYLCICYRAKILSFSERAITGVSFVANQLFAVDVSKVRVHLDKNTLLYESEVDDIIKQLSEKNLTKNKMQTIVHDITEKNPLVESVYMRKNLTNRELVVYIKERQIIGVFYHDDCVKGLDNCQKNIITTNNQLLPYHRIRNYDGIIKIYGKLGMADLPKAYNLLKKYSLIGKIAYIKFYSSGRFDLTLKNKLVVKFPRRNWLHAIRQFIKIDAEYLLSNDPQSIKYIDLRVDDKIYIG